MPVNKVGVLSISLPSIGHKVFGGLLRRTFADSDSIDFRSYWTDDRREPYARVINQLLRARVPSAWMNERNVDLRRVRAELGYAYYSRRLVERHLATTPIDVLHFHTQTAALVATDLMKRIPAVITCDQTAMQCALETDADWRWTHGPGVRIERAAFRAANAVVPFSSWAAKSVIEGHGVDPERVHVIPIGVALSDFADIDRSRRFVRSDRPLRILFVGGEFPRKGGPLLVRVFLERFAQRGVELHLVTTATGREAAAIVEHPQIIVHRGVKAFSPEWKQLYADADVFVLPTRWEAYGIVFVEAMAAGLPVIATSISAIPEIIAENETGLLIEKDDARALSDRLEAILTNAELRQRLGANGPRRVASLFDASKNAEKLGDVFLAAANRRTSAARVI